MLNPQLALWATDMVAGYAGLASFAGRTGGAFRTNGRRSRTDFKLIHCAKKARAADRSSKELMERHRPEPIEIKGLDHF